MDEIKSPPPISGRDVALILRRRWKIAAITFLVVVSATVALTSRMKRVYESQARVLIDDPSRGGSLPSNLMDLLQNSKGVSMDTQMEYIRSRALLTEVIRKGDLPYPPEYLAGKLRLSTAPGGQILDLGVQADSAEDAARIANLVAGVYAEYNKAERERSAYAAVERLVRTQQNARREKEAAERALRRFMEKLGTSDPASLFSIKAGQINTLRVSLDDQRKALELEKRRREKVTAQLRTIDPTIVSGYARNKNPIIDEYTTDLIRLERKKQNLLENFTEESEEVQEVNEDIRAVGQGIERALQQQFSNGSQSVVRNPDYSTAVSALIASEAAIALGETGIRLSEAQQKRLEQEQKVLAARKSQYEDLVRKQASAVATHEKLRTGIIEIDVRRATAEPSVRLFERARANPIPISPKPVRNTLLAVFLGLFLSLVTAVLAEYFAEAGRREGTEGLPRVGGIPLLGEVPVALAAPPGAELPVPAHASASVIEDALREAGYNLLHLRPAARNQGGAGAPVVLLVGTRTDDTTSNVAARLTATLVRDGMRVTLVDADRACPRLNHVFGAPDAPGMADVLAGRARVHDILHIGADHNLRFLAAGSPEDTTPVTERGMRSLLADLRKDTDLLIVSGPSVYSVPAVAPLQRAADGVVLVTPPGVLPDKHVARARRLLTNGYQPQILGVVLGETPDAIAWDQEDREEAAL